MPFDLGSLLIFAVVLVSGLVALKNQQSWKRLSLKQKVFRASLSAAVACAVAVGIVLIATFLKA